MNAFRHFAAPVVALCISAGVIGCASEPKAEQVPAGARLAMQGDQQLVYTVQDDGKVYIYDVDDGTLLYSGQVEKGQVVTVDPDEDTIMIDSRLALENDIPDRVIEERTTIREQSSGERIDPRDGIDTTIRREERRIETDPDGDVTVKKETTIKTE
jgi:hypothetical protein